MQCNARTESKPTNERGKNTGGGGERTAIDGLMRNDDESLLPIYHLTTYSIIGGARGGGEEARKMGLILLNCQWMVSYTAQQSWSIDVIWLHLSMFTASARAPWRLGS